MYFVVIEKYSPSEIPKQEEPDRSYCFNFNQIYPRIASVNSCNLWHFRNTRVFTEDSICSFEGEIGCWQCSRQCNAMEGLVRECLKFYKARLSYLKWIQKYIGYLTFLSRSRTAAFLKMKNIRDLTFHPVSVQTLAQPPLSEVRYRKGDDRDRYVRT